MTEEMDTKPADSKNGDIGSFDVPESEQKTLKYPKQVFFIIGNEFCERFCFYGNRTILAIYLSTGLHFSENNATIIYHTFVMFCYFFPVLGALIADCYLGKFRTILYLSVVYALGNVVLSVSSDFSLPINHSLFSILGLLLIAIGTGGIKPCVSSFGGDQFVLPQQERQLVSFFSVFYFSINAGSLISTYLTPELRVMSCLGQDTCYPLAFGVPAALMILATVIFVCGKPLYKFNNPEGNIMVDVSKCVSRGIWQKIRSNEKKDHWLDYAGDKYSPQLVKDTKILLEIIFLFSPTILFWALYDQQGSRWTFQATHMNGKVWGYNIKPDQMQVFNPILILLFIPIFDMIVYPLLEKCKLIRTAMQKLFWGGIIAAIAFAISSYVEYRIQDAYAVLPHAGEAQLRIYNSFNCTVQINGTVSGKNYSWTVPSMELLKELSVPVVDQRNLTYSAKLMGTNCPSLALTTDKNLTLFEKQAVSFITVGSSEGSSSILDIDRLDNSFDDLTKSDDGGSKIRIVYRVTSSANFRFCSKDNRCVSGILTPEKHVTDTFVVEPDRGYFLEVDGNNKIDVDLDAGGVYSILLTQSPDDERLFTLTPPNCVHVLWQLPQIIVITVAEIMFSITGLEFSYSEAPLSMKSVISSLWLLTDSFGNIIIIVTSELTKNIPQVYMLAVYAVCMVVVMGIFILLAKRYTNVMKHLKKL